MTTLRVLIVEDNASDAALVARELRRTGRAVESLCVEDATTMRAALAEAPWDLVISDWSMPTFSAMAALEVLKQTGRDLPFIIVSGTTGEERAVEAMRAGAHDFVLKEKLARLVPAVERELRECAERAARRAAEAALQALIEQSEAARRQSLAALQASEERYRHIIETTNEGVWMIDADAKTTFANARMAEILGCPASELKGRSPLEFLAADAHPLFTDTFPVLQTGGSRQVKVPFRRTDGTTVWTLLEASPMLDEAGAFKGALAMVMDVSARTRAEASLRVSEARFQGLWDSGLILVSIYDRTGTLREINDAGVRMLGRSREELIGGRLRWRDLTPPEWGEADARALGQLRAHGVARPWEKELFRKDGSRVPVLAGAAALQGDEAIAIGLDLTERKHAEATLHQTGEQLRQAQKMEAVGRLAGGVAHDFNNVLSVILGFAELAMNDLAPGAPLRSDLEEIRKAGQRAADLTRQLLMFSRQQVVEPRVIDLSELLANTEKMLRRLVGEDVDLVLRPARGLGLVRVDPSSIEQVVMNLVVNARDAMPTGGRLTLETANVDLDAAYARSHHGVQPGPYAMLAVSDTGTGMDAATLARIFDPFFTTKEQGKGTGLGLSTVFGIVQQSDGNIWVQSTLGLGTTFKVYLPTVDARADALPSAADPGLRRGTETVLLVEDEDQVRAVARSILHRYGYEVIEARDAADALLYCARHPGTIHLLLTDVVMPQMSGPELARRVIACRPSIKVLCMSGYTDDSMVRHGVLAAALAYIQKPITPDGLARRVREVLDAPSATTDPRTVGACPKPD